MDPRQPGPQPSAAPEDRRAGFARTFEALRYRGFRYLWLIQLSNSAGNWMQIVALPLLVLHVTEGSEVHLGLVMAGRTAPAMALGLFSGVMADMWNRKTILLVTRVTVSALSIWFAVVIVGGWVGLTEIYAFALIRGATMAFDQPPRRAILPSLVPDHAVTNATLLLSGSVQSTRILAAGAGGVLIAAFGLATPFVIVGALYVVGIPLLLMLRVQDHDRKGYTGVGPVFGDIKASLVFAWSTVAVRGALLIAVFFYVFGIAFMQVFAPLLARGPLGIGDSGFGVMIALLGLGGTVGALFIAYLNPATRRGTVLLLSLAVFGVLLILLAASSYLPVPWVAVVLVLFVGMGHAVFRPLITAILLQASPIDMRGRAMALLSYDRALVSLSAALAGFASAALGVQLALIAFGAMCVLGTLMLTVSIPSLRKVD